MSDHIERAADEIIGIQVGTGYESVTIGIDEAMEAARALDAAGLLASPEHDAAVAAKALPIEGCSCTPHEQDAGGGHTEYLLEYEPSCPDHSEHLWSPTQGMWVLRSEHDAEVRADERAKVRYVVFSSDWIEPPGDVIAVFATKAEAWAHIDGPGDGYGWSVVEVPAP